MSFASPSGKELRHARGHLLWNMKKANLLERIKPIRGSRAEKERGRES